MFENILFEQELRVYAIGKLLRTNKEEVKN